MPEAVFDHDAAAANDASVPPPSKPDMEATDEGKLEEDLRPKWDPETSDGEVLIEMEAAEGGRVLYDRFRLVNSDTLLRTMEVWAGEEKRTRIVRRYQRISSAASKQPTDAQGNNRSTSQNPQKHRSGSKRPAPLKELKYQHNFTGVWLFDKAASQSMDPYFKAIGVPWIARRMVNGVKITSTIRHCNSRLLLNDASSLGGHTSRFVLDGRWRRVRGQDGKEARVRAWQGSSGSWGGTKEEWESEGRWRKGVWDKDGRGPGASVPERILTHETDGGGEGGGGGGGGGDARSKSRAKSRGRGSRSDREKWREMEEGDTGEVEEEGPPSWQPSVEEGEVVTEVELPDGKGTSVDYRRMMDAGRLRLVTELWKGGKCEVRVVRELVRAGGDEEVKYVKALWAKADEESKVLEEEVVKGRRRRVRRRRRKTYQLKAPRALWKEWGNHSSRSSRSNKAFVLRYSAGRGLGAQ